MDIVLHELHGDLDRKSSQLGAVLATGHSAAVECFNGSVALLRSRWVLPLGCSFGSSPLSSRIGPQCIGVNARIHRCAESLKQA